MLVLTAGGPPAHAFVMTPSPGRIQQSSLVQKESYKALAQCNTEFKDGVTQVDDELVLLMKARISAP